MATDFDVQLGDFKFHLARGTEDVYGPSYDQSFVRQQLQSQRSLSGAPTMQSRSDIAFMYQTDWAGGQEWWLPLVTGDMPDSYHHAKGVDFWSRPGSAQPTPQPVKITPGITLNDGTKLCDANGTVFMVADTTLVNGSAYDVIKWDPATDDVVTTVFHATVTADPFGMVFNKGDGYVYTVGSLYFGRFDPDAGSSEGSILNLWATGKEGTSLLVHNDLTFVYNGDELRYISDPGGTPAWVEVFDDGMGYDWLADKLSNSTGIINRRNVNLAISTPEGIFYVKNIDDGGLPTPWVYRVEKAQDGTWVGYPITVLPRGTVALDVNIHLGSLIISTVHNYEALVDNNAAVNIPVTYYHVSGGNIGTLGSPLGYNDTYGLYDTPVSILGSWGSELYIGGKYSLWVYDAVRGGIHQLGYFTNPTAGTTVDDMPGGWALTTDSNDEPIHLIVVDGQLWTLASTPTTGLSSGFFESNWFDMGIPFEDKTIYKMELYTDEMQDDVVWQLWLLSEDEDKWRLIGQTGAGKYHEWDLTTRQTAKMFRYRLSYGDITPDLPSTAAVVTEGPAYNYDVAADVTVGLASHSIGDLVIVQVLTTSSGSVTMPAGWTLAGSETTGDKHYVYYKAMTEVEPAITVTQGAAQETIYKSVAVADWGTFGVVPETVRSEADTDNDVQSDQYTDAEIGVGYELWYFVGGSAATNVVADTADEGGPLAELYNDTDLNSTADAGTLALFRVEDADGSNQRATFDVS